MINTTYRIIPLVGVNFSGKLGKENSVRNSFKARREIVEACELAPLKSEGFNLIFE